MVAITFIEPDGDKHELDVPEGWNLMEAAVRNGVEGIDAECGGACCCATCHVYLDSRYMPSLPVPNVTEDELLDCTAEVCQDNSRLACQVEVTEDLDGVVITIPQTQI